MSGSAEPLSDDWLNNHELALVYFAKGRMAHLMTMGEVNSRYGLGPLCKRVPWWHTPLGTGTQLEWERARALPLCSKCREFL